MGSACYDPLTTVDSLTADSAPLSAGKVFSYYVQCNNESVVDNPIAVLLNSSYYEALQINGTLNEYYVDINLVLSDAGFSNQCAIDMLSSVSFVMLSAYFILYCC